MLYTIKIKNKCDFMSFNESQIEKLEKADIDSLEAMAMQPSKHAIGHVKALWTRAFAIKKSSMELNHTDACRCHLQCPTASRNANSAGEI